MSPFLFWLFASLTLIFGAAVVLNPNPIASALSLVASFLSAESPRNEATRLSALDADLRRGCRPQSESHRKRAEPGCFVPRALSAVHVARCLFYRHYSGTGLCGSGDGPVPVRHHAARFACRRTTEDQLAGRGRRLRSGCHLARSDMRCDRAFPSCETNVHATGKTDKR